MSDKWFWFWTVMIILAPVWVAVAYTSIDLLIDRKRRDRTR